MKPDELTNREWDVARLMAQGYSNKEMALKLNVSVRTVETHRKNLINKLGTSSIVDIMAYVQLQRRTKLEIETAPNYIGFTLWFPGDWWVYSLSSEFMV